MTPTTISTDRRIYFVSDMHFGAPNRLDSLERERLLVEWLDEITPNCAELFLVGDLFDFWFEYRHVVPKGYTRLLGKLAFMADAGIKLHIYKGNHDLWMKQYFKDEFGATVYSGPTVFEYGGKRFYIAHGDGLGPGDHGYKFLKRVFTNPVCRALFGALHPSWGIGLANFFSARSRMANGEYANVGFRGEDKEWLVIHSKDVLQTQPEIDYFIYGHAHYPIRYPLPDGQVYLNLGDWINFFSYADFDGEDLRLHFYTDAGRQLAESKRVAMR